MEKEIKKNEKKIKKKLNVKNVKLTNKEIRKLPDFKSLTTKNASLKDKKVLRPDTSKLLANVNNYRFLFDVSNKESKDNTKWVLNLRTFEDF